jgi:hypothetical protein
MKLPALRLLSLLALVFTLGACQKAPPLPNEEVVFEGIRDNLRAMEKEDVDGVMATIHPQSEYYESTRAVVREMFEQVDVKYQLSDLKLVASTPEEAKVTFTQSMEKTGGPGEFRDNIVQGLHTLRLDQGKWKIYRTQNFKITGLDGQPLSAPPAAPEESTPASATPAPPPPAPAEKPAQ